MTNNASTGNDARSYRLTNIDMLRGLVIIIMAIDHARDFFYVGGISYPMEQPDIGLSMYLTRWVTHFCAPVFVFLAGTSVGLMNARKSKNEIAALTFKRGIWLVLGEIFIISNAYSFAPFGEPALGGYTQVHLEVIWAIGVSMIVLSAAQFLGARFCFTLGLMILFGHNLLDPIWPGQSVFDPYLAFWHIIHQQGQTILGPFILLGGYPVLPWVGVMFLGCGTASIFQRPADERDAFLKKIGLVIIGLFFIIRFMDVYGDPNPWQMQDAGLLATIFDFMNLSKYPASLLYILATIGPMALVCAYADRWTGWFKDTLVMFGRVPFAFYVTHLILLHLISIAVGIIQGFEFNQFMHIYAFYPEGYGLGLIGVYGIWALVIIILYPLCKWIANLKANRKDWWLSYV
ncbi:MAG: heparan-alpha-glucosaminide N-acetyltransferase domain-containing protein [Emcibacteraceae bacterium]|nr:heparan-alpha-glucosaminide N-acetyltransferase domain-containing protein [Emcibacteraceae bacterium]